jgi:hypothetical protein
LFYDFWRSNCVIPSSKYSNWNINIWKEDQYLTARLWTLLEYIYQLQLFFKGFELRSLRYRSQTLITKLTPQRRFWQSISYVLQSSMMIIYVLS